jgi:hypothetical protein
MNIPDDALQALLRPALAERAGLTRQRALYGTAGCYPWWNVKSAFAATGLTRAGKNTRRFPKYGKRRAQNNSLLRASFSVNGREHGY